MPTASPEPDDWSAGTKFGWITVDNEVGAFDCRRCLIHEPFPMPVQFFDWHRQAAEFVAEHRGCKAAAKPVEQIQTSLL